VRALYARIAAPTLMIEAADDSLQGWWKNRYTLEEFHQRLASVPSVRIEQLADAGHMLHHDQPQRVAKLIEDFLA
jgi:pimeloyl-ACP methyl ester carboxylesterase